MLVSLPSVSAATEPSCKCPSGMYLAPRAAPPGRQRRAPRRGTPRHIAAHRAPRNLHHAQRHACVAPVQRQDQRERLAALRVLVESTANTHKICPASSTTSSSSWPARLAEGRSSNMAWWSWRRVVSGLSTAGLYTRHRFRPRTCAPGPAAACRLAEIAIGVCALVLPHMHRCACMHVTRHGIETP